MLFAFNKQGTDVPFVVIQWNMVLAVNYSARKYGVLRFETLAESLKKCPHLKYVHVQTFSRQGKEPPAYHPNPKKSTHKVSLDAYREASSKIFSVLDQFCSTLQRASVDEAYLDLTDLAWQRLQLWRESKSSHLNEEHPGDHSDHNKNNNNNNNNDASEESSNFKNEPKKDNDEPVVETSKKPSLLSPAKVPLAPTFKSDGKIDWTPVGSIQRESAL